jgi:hypothetical protein
VVHHVVAALVHAPTVGTGRLESFADVFDVEDIGVDDVFGPLDGSAGRRVTFIRSLLLNYDAFPKCCPEKENHDREAPDIAKKRGARGWQDARRRLTLSVSSVPLSGSTYIFFALQTHFDSYAQSKHRLASPASAGFLEGLKCPMEPNEWTFFGVRPER